MRRVSCFLLFIFCLVPAGGQTDGAGRQPFWLMLESGKKAFREGDYGKALAYFEDARNVRRAFFTRLETSFIVLLSIREVRRLGDALDSIERYAAERNHPDAEAALAELYYRVGRTALGNSAKTALEFFGRLKEYPESEYWIGEVYRVEGEYRISAEQYKKALEKNIDEEAAPWKNDALYKMAEVNRSMQNYTTMERLLNDILKSDSMWNNNNTFIRNSMSHTLQGSGLNEFLMMFRHKSVGTEKAHRFLGEFFYKSGRYILAENHFAFAVMEQNTVLIEEAIRKRYDFAFTTLDALIEEINRRPDLKRYMEDVEYYKTLYYLAASLYAEGKSAPASGIWTFVSGRSEAAEWAGRSRTQLKSPFIEAPLKMPY